MARESIVTHVASFYAARGDIDFSQVVATLGDVDDAALAELIEQDGRTRVARQLPVTLDRYFDAIPGLLEHRDALDAAIDVNLRWLAGGPRPTSAAVEELVSLYPHLDEEIRDAAALGNALWSTAGLRNHMTGESNRVLPAEFGPPMDDGSCRYLLEQLIGSGAFGDVYKAVDRQLSEEGHPAMVAVKILGERSGQLTADKGQRLLGRPRLLEEATKARRVIHPNVVRVLDRGVAEDDSAFIVYELVEGGDLDHWIHARSAPVPVTEAAKMVARIARGVQAAHSAGLVHCDLKPGNVILTTEGEPMVADFGIAVRFGQSRPGEYDVEALDANHPIGNVAFISPEQYRMDEGALTVPADIYALGGMLYMLLTGRLPNGSTLKEIARTHDREKGRKAPPQVRTHRPEVDRDLEAICRRAMAIRPEDRYSSAGALADDLEAWLRMEPLYWTNPSIVRVLDLWRRRKPATAIISGCLVLSVVIGGLLANHFAGLAAVSAVEAAEARAEQEIAEAEARLAQMREDMLASLNAQAIDQLRRIRDGFVAVAMQGRARTEILPKLWSMEYLFAPEALRFEGHVEELREVRFKAVEQLVMQLQSEGRERDLDAMLWQTTLAFWLVGEGDVDRAQPLLNQLRTLWLEMLHPNDRWLGYFDAIIACAEIRALNSNVGTAPLEPTEIEMLEAAASVLLEQERRLSHDDAGSPLHLLMMETLVMLYQPTLLDQPDRLAAVQRTLDDAVRTEFRRR